MAADLGWWKNGNDETDFRGEILKALALEPASLMFCLSHTHSGPSICRSEASRPGGHFIEGYWRRVQKLAVRAARRAQAAAVPAILTWRYGRCDLAANRDLPEKEGDGRFICGYNPAQPADDTLLVGRVTNPRGRILATIVNYACHPTTLAWDNHLLSPDYIGAMREVVENETRSPCLFLQGASGELAPAEQYVGDVAVADAHGRRLGHAALATLGGMLPPATRIAFHGVVESGASLAIWKQTPDQISRVFKAEISEVKFALKPSPSIAKLEQAWRKCDDRTLKERLWRQISIRKKVGTGKITLAPLWVWRLGDSFLIGQPNEPYSKFQQELRHCLLSPAVAVMNLVNGSTGYLPTRNMYGKNVYPVWQTPFAKGSLERLTEAAVSMTQRSAKEHRFNPGSSA